MSFSVVTSKTVELAGEGRRLATVLNGDVWIWPEGIGVGTAVVVSVKDWGRVNREVRWAMMSHDGQAGRAEAERAEAGE